MHLGNNILYSMTSIFFFFFGNIYPQVGVKTNGKDVYFHNDNTHIQLWDVPGGLEIESEHPVFLMYIYICLKFFNCYFYLCSNTSLCALTASLQYLHSYSYFVMRKQSATQCICAYRHGRDSLLKFKPTIRMGKKADSSDFGIVVGVRLRGLI